MVNRDCSKVIDNMMYFKFRNVKIFNIFFLDFRIDKIYRCFEDYWKC